MTIFRRKILYGCIMKMEINQLRIGNWVKPKYSSGIESNEGTVFCINGYLVSVSTNKNLYDIHLIDPIKLTDEWFLKFGFDLIDDQYYSKHTQCGIGGLGITKKDYRPLVLVVDERQYDGVYRQVIGKQIEYVHELQNLYFALTGEELKIEENKDE